MPRLRAWTRLGPTCSAITGAWRLEYRGRTEIPRARRDRLFEVVVEEVLVRED